jgi:hypothetical protein
MRIAELIIENTQVDELSLKGIGQGLSKAANTVGGAIGGAQGQWQGMKNVYAQKRDRMAAVAQRNAERAGGYKKPAAAPATTPPAQGAPSNPSSISATSGGTGTPYVNTGVSAPSASTPTSVPPAAGTAPPASQPARTAVGKTQAIQAVDQAVGQIQKVRNRDRQSVVQTAKQKIDALAATASSPPPVQQPAASAVPPEDDNPNIVRGYNESRATVGYHSRFLEMTI